MTDHSPCRFDDTLISGHLDGELTQAAEQRVSIHLEDCSHCRTLLGDLQEMREATMSTEFQRPDDDQWDERPRGTTSLLTRGTGWVLAAVWLRGSSATAYGPSGNRRRTSSNVCSYSVA